ncbi:MAG: protein translocase subunit SecD [Micromonosporaceae bacterium]|jgi:preprotein translocase subunit SecD
MAQNPPSPGRPGRQLAVLALSFVLLYGLALFSGTSGMGWLERLEPRLGLDLVGGTRVTFLAVTEDGANPAPDQLEQARQIIESRVNALGVEEAEVVSEGDNLIVISVAGEGEDALRSVGQPAELRFRKVLYITDGSGTSMPRPSPSASASPGPSGSPEPTPSPGASAEPEPTPSPTDSPAAGASPSPSASPGPSASPSPGGEKAAAEELRQQVIDIVGQEALDAALRLTGPANLASDPELAETLEPFSKLTGEQVAVLPAKVQFNVPTISCAQLNARPPGSIRDTEQVVVACDEVGVRKFLLDHSTVVGPDIDNAKEVLDPRTNAWSVSLDFSGEGQRKWTALTQEAVNTLEGAPLDQSQLGEDNLYSGTRPIQCDQFTAVGREERHCLVAVVLDNIVVSAPEILQVLSRQSQITGDFTASEARTLATQLRYGALPLTFEQQESQTVTATLGTEYLRAGLIAAGIGMALVMLYSFFYYRLLGIVIIGSLVISSLLIYAALVVLGRSMGFTLTLAGISGFIVAVGVAADSFVIYFERVKDEVREGRTPRSAVARGWVRARRTIISANVVTLLAAVVLWLLSAGQVRGFAFALGLATVLDLLVVFTFRHPIMTLLARTRAFLSPTVSGLGRALELERAATRARGPRTREA